MKLVSLRIKNLNSLYGEWSIDFSAEEFRFNSIFAIVGPTGSGKTSILDGICLALFGRTPRLKSISKNNNDIMSKNSKECFAELAFSNNTNAYSVHWSQRRSQRSKNSHLLESKHELVNLQTGSVIATKKRQVQAMIQELIGLDYDRFARSVMLSQGEFAAFLQAQADERAPILEQITGTEIYSEISKKVYDRYKIEGIKFHEIEDSLHLLEPIKLEQERGMLENMEASKEKEASLRKESLLLEKQLAYYDTYSLLKKDYSSIVEEREDFLPAWHAAKSRSGALKRSIEAKKLQPFYNDILKIRSEVSSSLDELQSQEKKIESVEEDLLVSQTKLETSEEDLKEFLELKASEEEKILAARRLDLLIGSRKEQLEKIAAEKIRINNEIGRCAKLQEGIFREKNTLERRLEELDSVVQDLCQTQDLDAIIGWIEIQKNNFFHIHEKTKLREKTSIDLEAKIAKLLLQEEESGMEASELSQKLLVISSTIKSKKEKLTALLLDRSINECKEDLEDRYKTLNYLGKIVSLEKERKHLQKGENCPLCGSLEHPFNTHADSDVYRKDKEQLEEKIAFLSQIIAKSETLQKEIDKLNLDTINLEFRKSESAKRIDLVNIEILEIRKDIYKIKKEVKNFKSQIDSIGNDIKRKIFWYFEKDEKESLVEFNIDQVLLGLKKLRKRRELLTKDKNEILEKIERLSQEVNNLDGKKTILAAALVANEAEQIKGEHGFEEMQSDRLRIFACNDPEERKKEIERDFVYKISEVKRYKEIDKNLKRQKKELFSSLADQKNKHRILLADQEKLEMTFSKKLQEKNFADEIKYKEAYLDQDELDIQMQEYESIQLNYARIEAKYKNSMERLRQIESNIDLDMNCDEISEKKQSVLKNLDIERENIGILKQKLGENNLKKESYQQHKNKLAMQKKVLRKWSILSDLIGSLDGKKYRNFAQGLTFEVLLKSANAQLAKMNDRYLLIRDPAKVLEMNVVDKFQAGEMRTTKNLSGGEGFIISLALALGLANMAKGRSQLDCLFLDEGFGTLDDTSLELTLSTLGQLQQHGTLIGVISHVPALKERINNQIQIIPSIGGNSTISGPGCKQLSRS